MSNTGISQMQTKGVGQGFSKRDQMKLEKAIKRIQSQENTQIKHPKRRGHPNHQALEPNHRKQIKIDSSLRNHQHQQNISSPINSSELSSTTPPPPSAPSQHLPSHLNPNYSLPEDEGGIFNYLMMYTYSQGEKKMQKQYKDWSKLGEIGAQKLMLLKSQASIAIGKTLHKKYNQMKERIREPFDKGHKEFNQQLMKNQK